MSDFATLATAGKNVFLTGQAGTGKSTVLREWMAREGRDADVVAPTGIAALNVGGMTIHRWAGIGIGPEPDESFLDFAKYLCKIPAAYTRNARQRIRACRTLVIDEVSMLPGRVLDFLNFWLRFCRDDDRPFGGIQVIATGDFLQLPPVRRDQQPYDWAFESKSWTEADFATVRLQKIWRQTDLKYLETLSDVRRGRLSARSSKTLEQCVKMFPPARLTRLCTHNRDVDRVNFAMLDDLSLPEFVYEATFSTNNEKVRAWFKKNSITPMRLALRLGARVMFTANDSEGRFVNGTTGWVDGMTANSVTVATDEGETILANDYEWELNPRARNSEKMWQIPLRVAYAMTIHKSQGTTLPGAYIDIRAALEPGQAYVALSRVKTLEGLWLKASPTYLSVCPRALKFQEAVL